MATRMKKVNTISLKIGGFYLFVPLILLVQGAIDLGFENSRFRYQTSSLKPQVTTAYEYRYGSFHSSGDKPSPQISKFIVQGRDLPAEYNALIAENVTHTPQGEGAR